MFVALPIVPSAALNNWPGLLLAFGDSPASAVFAWHRAAVCVRVCVSEIGQSTVLSVASCRTAWEALALVLQENTESLSSFCHEHLFTVSLKSGVSCAVRHRFPQVGHSLHFEVVKNTAS